jgi:hypothetical protein
LCFRKVTQEIFSELDETKAEVPIFPEKARTEMMPRIPEKKAAPLRRLLLLILKSQAWIRKGNISMSCFPRVPLL